MFKWSNFAIVFALIALISADVFYFKHYRNQFDGGSINESIIKNSRLGSILKKNGLIAAAPESGLLSTQNLCASKEHLDKPNHLSSYRLRLSLYTLIRQHIDVIISSKIGENTITKTHRLFIEPKKHAYSLPFNSNKMDAVDIKISPTDKLQSLLLEALDIDGQFGKTINIMSQGNMKIGTNIYSDPPKQEQHNAKLIRGVIVSQIKNFHFQLNRVPLNVYAMTLPGKKSSGYCQYSATVQRQIPKSELIPAVSRVSLNIEDKYLNGEHGILTNLKSRGRSSEVPAMVTFSDHQSSFSQLIGARFHGGDHRRRNNMHGYRLYARSDYGYPNLAKQSFFSTSSAPLKTLVIRNLQSYGTLASEYGRLESGFNPYGHALALDIGREIKALVPRSKLVDFYLNGAKQDLYLALEHLSQRTFNNALGHNKALFHVYKDIDSDQKAENILAKIGSRIRKYFGHDNMFEVFKSYYDVDNVINSIILTAYIGDRDFCQGVEILEDFTDDGRNAKITTVNWDLDGGFMQFDSTSRITKLRPDSYAFRILDYGKRNTECYRQYVYSSVYAGSKKFRALFRKRLESLLKKELSPDNINTLLEKYSNIDKHYYSGKYHRQILDLQKFAEQRPKILLAQLEQLEHRYHEN